MQEIGGGGAKQQNGMHASYGEYPVRRIKISRTYLYDLLKGRVKPPASDLQEKMILVLGLSDDERNEFYNRTAAERGELLNDIFDYLYCNEDEILWIRERMQA